MSESPGTAAPNINWSTQSPRCFAVIDVETTGLKPSESSIIEIAIIALDNDGETVSEWSTLVRPPGDSELGATHIHGITRSMVAEAPSFTEIADDIVALLQGAVVVGHVVTFDIGHLATEFARIGRPLPDLGSASICTRDLARDVLGIRPVTLENCCTHLGITIHGAHSALGDTRATGDLFRRLLGDLPLEEMARTRDNADQLAWSTPMFATRERTARPRRPN